MMQAVINTEHPEHSVSVETLLGMHNVRGSARAALSAVSVVSALRSTAVLPGNFAEHITDESNPHRVTCEQIGAEPAGRSGITVGAHNTDVNAHANIMPTKIGNQSILALFR